MTRISICCRCRMWGGHGLPSRINVSVRRLLRRLLQNSCPTLTSDLSYGLICPFVPLLHWPRRLAQSFKLWPDSPDNACTSLLSTRRVAQRLLIERLTSASWHCNHKRRCQLKVWPSRTVRSVWFPAPVWAPEVNDSSLSFVLAVYLLTYCKAACFRGEMVNTP